MATLDRTKANPWSLKTPPGTAEYTMQIDEKDGVRVLVCTVGKTVLLYDARCIDDLHAMLRAVGEWVELGGADEQKPAKEGMAMACWELPTLAANVMVALRNSLVYRMRTRHDSETQEVRLTFLTVRKTNSFSPWA